ncbi:MAG: Beta-hexosaminidase, partial [Bacteroidota bacterium]
MTRAAGDSINFELSHCFINTYYLLLLSHFLNEFLTILTLLIMKRSTTNFIDPKFHISLMLLMGIGCILSFDVFSQNSSVYVVPKPQIVYLGTGEFKLSDATKIIVQANSFAEGTKLSNFLKKATGYPFPVIMSADTSAVNHIALSLLTNTNATIGEEGYILTVKSNLVTIQANTTTGLFYGWQTLRQMLPNKIEAKAVVANMSWVMPVATITDSPRFKWRSFMQDDSRYFYGVAATKKLLDLMAMIKLNKFHWHLVDDHGWRIEIKSKPKLQSIASVNTCAGRNSGYYTQDQITEIVNYAAALHIDVIPEIEMPGHSVEVLAAYPELSCTTPTAPYGGPFSVQCKVGASVDFLCAGKEATFNFMSEVLDEVAPLFPASHMHLGGDETKDFSRWDQCRDCSNRKITEGLSSNQELKTYFMNRVANMVFAKNKQWIGWSGVETNNIPPANGVLQYWERESNATPAAAITVKAGYSVILSPYDRTYFDMCWANGQIGAKWGPPIDLEKAYTYEPMPTGLSVLEQSRILGVEGDIWSDLISSEEIKEYMVAPRIFATSDINWATGAKDYTDFVQRLYSKYERLDSLEFNHHKPDVIAKIFITSQPVTVAKADSFYSYTFSGYSNIGVTVTYSALTKPSWLNINSITGVLSGTPSASNIGTFPVTLRVSDGTLYLDQTFLITVSGLPGGYQLVDDFENGDGLTGSINDLGFTIVSFKAQLNLNAGALNIANNVGKTDASWTTKCGGLDYSSFMGIQIKAKASSNMSIMVSLSQNKKSRLNLTTSYQTFWLPWSSFAVSGNSVNYIAIGELTPANAIVTIDQISIGNSTLANRS